MIRRMGDAELILEIVEGSSTGRQIAVSGPVELGRDPQLDAALADDQVSRRHARVMPSPGGVVIEDLDSLNGTYVNDQVVEAPQRLGPGDRVRVGLTVLELRTIEQVSVQRAAIDPAPEITVLGRDVLEVVPEEQLAPIQHDAPHLAGFLAEETEPAYIRPGAARGDSRAPARRAQNPEDVARLFDVRVKQQTNVAAFAILAIAALAVLLYFGVT